mmetsp:Transcript_30816/g.61011  ORF Transcript_30816/g.61011 Transcript_30816/m.61011 type:complete len:674 (-) Transcript_30816:420-2441(-)
MLLQTINRAPSPSKFQLLSRSEAPYAPCHTPLPSITVDVIMSSSLLATAETYPISLDVSSLSSTASSKIPPFQHAASDSAECVTSLCSGSAGEPLVTSTSGTGVSPKEQSAKVLDLKPVSVSEPNMDDSTSRSNGRSSNRSRSKDRSENKSACRHNIQDLSHNLSCNTIRNSASSLEVGGGNQKSYSFLNPGAKIFSYPRKVEDNSKEKEGVTTENENRSPTLSVKINMNGASSTPQSNRPTPAEGPLHTSVLCYYRYFPHDVVAAIGAKLPVQSMVFHQRTLCRRLGLRGRVQISSEGIHGTVSGANADVLREYVGEMESTILGERGMVEDARTQESDISEPRPYAKINWNWSSTGGMDHIFPDLKVVKVKEIVSTGGSVSVRDVFKYGGTRLDPKQFHEMLTSRHPSGKPPILLDVRNTFEHAVGHFVDTAGAPAEQPVEMKNFSTFEKEYCKKKGDALADRTVMMYCADGMICEKASAALKKCGVREVYQLNGGIHRYLEEYPTGGMFRGKNFVFDQRVTAGEGDGRVVGQCTTCYAPYDKLCGSRVCTVCRDLVLTCSNCRSELRELHCQRHAYLATCYFTFLEPFTGEELSWQLEGLRFARESQESNNVRKSITKHIMKVMTRIEALGSGEVAADPDAPRRCRTCMKPSNVCDGRCWGFWRRLSPTKN